MSSSKVNHLCLWRNLIVSFLASYGAGTGLAFSNLASVWVEPEPKLSFSFFSSSVLWPFIELRNIHTILRHIELSKELLFTWVKGSVEKSSCDRIKRCPGTLSLFQLHQGLANEPLLILSTSYLSHYQHQQHHQQPEAGNQVKACSVFRLMSSMLFV